MTASTELASTVLANTGVEVASYVVGAVILVALGAAALIFGRRKHDH